eukprot:365057-Chlamydomonas_euryale.AAC.20
MCGEPSVTCATVCVVRRLLRLCSATGFGICLRPKCTRIQHPHVISKAPDAPAMLLGTFCNPAGCEQGLLSLEHARLYTVDQEYRATLWKHLARTVHSVEGVSASCGGCQTESHPVEASSKGSAKRLPGIFAAVLVTGAEGCVAYQRNGCRIQCDSARIPHLRPPHCINASGVFHARQLPCCCSAPVLTSWLAMCVCGMGSLRAARSGTPFVTVHSPLFDPPPSCCAQDRQTLLGFAPYTPDPDSSTMCRHV